MLLSNPTLSSPIQHSMLQFVSSNNMVQNVNYNAFDSHFADCRHHHPHVIDLHKSFDVR